MGHKRQRSEVSAETSTLKRLRIGEGNEEKPKTNSQSEESEEEEISNYYYPGETESSSNADELSSYKAESWESEESESQDKWPRTNRWKSRGEFDEEAIV
ncbi:hypothetical protein niasHT_016951 [Heterodera trifolii]|uniref:Uncharacterized protein n=1 Tax=Heterodera trifolii TaxID=157864 RepID=A0ABD2LB37_9BILA